MICQDLGSRIEEDFAASKPCASIHCILAHCPYQALLSISRFGLRRVGGINDPTRTVRPRLLKVWKAAADKVSKDAQTDLSDGVSILNR